MLSPLGHGSGICDVIDLHRRLIFLTKVRTENGQVVRVELIFHARLKRWTGPAVPDDSSWITCVPRSTSTRFVGDSRRFL